MLEWGPFPARSSRSGFWMTWIKQASGVVILAMAEYSFIQMRHVL